MKTEDVSEDIDAVKDFNFPDHPKIIGCLINKVNQSHHPNERRIHVNTNWSENKFIPKADERIIKKQEE